MARQYALQLAMDLTAALQVIGKRRRVVAHECFRCFDGSFSLDRSSLPQSERVRNQPVEHISLFRPAHLVELHAAVAEIQVEQPVTFYVEERLN